MKISKKKLEILTETANKFKPSGSWSTGYQLDFISEGFANILGNTKIRINVPYAGFNCRGTANKIAKDVKGLMPFSNKRIAFSRVTTLYYVDDHVKQSNYLPFLSSSDCFYVKDIDTSDSDYIVINLVKGANWRMYL